VVGIGAVIVVITTCLGIVKMPVVHDRLFFRYHPVTKFAENVKPIITKHNTKVFRFDGY
jgi:hypothetical protein